MDWYRKNLELTKSVTKTFEQFKRFDDLYGKSFRKIADKLGLSEFTFHSLRHTYASWLVQRGVGLKEIKELLGHESIKTTEIYAHLSPENLRSAVSVLDR